MKTCCLGVAVLMSFVLPGLHGEGTPKIVNNTILFDNNISIKISTIATKTPGKIIRRSWKEFNNRWILIETHNQSEDYLDVYYFLSRDGKLLGTPVEVVGKPIFCQQANRIFIPQASYMSYGQMPTLLLDGEGKVIVSIPRRGSPFMSGVTKDQQQYWIVWVKAAKGRTTSTFESYNLDGKCVFTKDLSGSDELVEWDYLNKREKIQVKKASEFDTFD